MVTAMREIVFDTETTGLDPRDGHRLVEFAGIELRDRVATGRVLHFHVNPGRPMPAEAEAVHGLTDEFLAAMPPFADKAAALLDFLGDAVLVAHNAAFDMRFLNMELERLGMSPIEPGRFVDTLELARQRFPGAKHTLDALCLRFGIDRTARVRHGALIDAGLLADVYVELTGGRQIGLELVVAATTATGERPACDWPARSFEVPAAMKDPLWLRA